MYSLHDCRMLSNWRSVIWSYTGLAVICMSAKGPVSQEQVNECEPGKVL